MAASQSFFNFNSNSVENSDLRRTNYLIIPIIIK
jgi:hypothetical protein